MKNRALILLYLTVQNVCPSACRELGWEAATERMLDAGYIGAKEWPGPISTAQEAMAWSLYNSVTGVASHPHGTC